MDETNPHVRDTGPSAVGPIVGIAVIVVLLLFGALYFWNTKVRTTMHNIAPSAPAATTTP